jgi:hypothetical protein
MATSPLVFPFAHIVLTAAITAVVTLLVLVVRRPRFKMLSLDDCLLVAVVVGISVIVWRSAGNTGALNNDPIPPVSPNDVLCPLVTYLFIGFKEHNYGKQTGPAPVHSPATTPGG